MRPQHVISFVSLFLAAPVGLLFPTPYSPLSTPVALAQTTQDRKAEANRLRDEADQLMIHQQYRTALHSYQQALKIYQALQNNDGELYVLNRLATTYLAQRNFEEAIEYAYRQLNRAKETASHTSEISALENFYWIYRRQLNYPKAIESAQQALALAQKFHARDRQADALFWLDDLYAELGDGVKARKYRALRDALIHQLNSDKLEKYRQDLALARQQRNTKDELDALGHLAEFTRNADYSEQLLRVARRIHDSEAEMFALSLLGEFYMSAAHLAKPEPGSSVKAVDYLQQLLTLARSKRNESYERNALELLSLTYDDLHNSSKASEYRRQLIALSQKQRDPSGELYSLCSLARAAFQSAKYPQAIDYYQQCLVLARKVHNPVYEFDTLVELGETYQYIGDYGKAIESYLDLLTLKQTTSDRYGQLTALRYIGSILVKENKPELAIVFYKQSINIYESIREDIRKLPRETQESYAQSVASTYRNLADLLIQQGRLPEAQAVLELLKLRELKDFTRDAGIDSPGINLANVEATALKQILQRYTTVGEFSQKIAACEQTHCPELQQLQDQRNKLNQAVTAELNQQRAVLAKYFSTESATLVPEKLNAEARRIVNAQPGTVLIYPLVLKDKIQFLLALKAGDGAVTFRPFETRVSAETLFKTIQTFRQQLQSPGDLAALQATSQQLYTWLIKPLEPELNNPAIKHLVFAPDSTTRYIPLAALFDGKHYLIDRYSLSTITAASKTDTSETFAKLAVNASFLLAAGASTFANANPLDNVPAELDAIVKLPNNRNPQGIYPGVELLNTQFDFEALKASLKGHRVLHIATHGKFQPGRPEDSYLLPGRGQNLTTALIDQLGDYGLGDIHLVVLSACETAVGDRASDGMEIPGISYFFLKNEVKAVMASLWSVNDASTSLMMQQFYKQLATGKTTKAEALQLVQQQFITGKLTAKNAPNRSPTLLPKGSPQRQSTNGAFSHPYYWAPFILIGNSL
jgi:CHAT domain-containing protein